MLVTSMEKVMGTYILECTADVERVAAILTAPYGVLRDLFTMS